MVVVYQVAQLALDHIRKHLGETHNVLLLSQHINDNSGQLHLWVVGLGHEFVLHLLNFLQINLVGEGFLLQALQPVRVVEERDV